MPQNDNFKTNKIKQNKKPHKRRVRRFVDYSLPANFNKLSTRQKFYVKTMATHFRMDIRNMTREDYLSLPTEMRGVVLNKIDKILSGEEYRKLQETAMNNYVSALKFYGKEELADKLEDLKDELSESDKEKLMAELPGLYLFYKDKKFGTPLKEAQGFYKAHFERDQLIEEEDITFQLNEAKSVLEKWTENKKEDIKEENDED